MAKSRKGKLEFIKFLRHRKSFAAGGFENLLSRLVVSTWGVRASHATLDLLGRPLQIMYPGLTFAHQQGRASCIYQSYPSITERPESYDKPKAGKILTECEILKLSFFTAASSA